MRRVPHKPCQAAVCAASAVAEAGEALPPAPGAQDAHTTAEDDDENGKPVKAVGCLLTFNGTWNTDPTIVACILDELAGQPWRVVGDALRLVPCLANLFAEFWQRMMELCKLRQFANASCTLEVSLNSTLKGRVHLHAFLTLASKHRGVSGLSDSNAFTFRNRPASHIAAWRSRTCACSDRRPLLLTSSQSRIRATVVNIS